MSTMAYSQIALGMGPNGALQLVGIGVDGNTYVISAQSSSFKWTPFEPPLAFPAPSAEPVKMTSIVTGIGNSSYLQVVTLAAGGVPYLPCSQATGQPGWSAPSSTDVPLPHNSIGNPSQIAAGQGYSSSGAAFHVLGIYNGTSQPTSTVSWQDSSGAWHAGGSIRSLSGTYSNLGTGTGNSGYLQVLALQSGKVVLTAWEDTSGSWHSGIQLGQVAVSYTAMFVGPGDRSYLPVFCLDSTGAPYLATYLDSGGRWHAGQALTPPPGTSFTQLASARAGDGSIQVVGLGTDGAPYLVASASGSGSTYTWSPGAVIYRGPRAFTQIVMAADSRGHLCAIGLSAGDARPLEIGTYLPVGSDQRWTWIPA